MLAFVITALVQGLRQHPYVNSVWSDSGVDPEARHQHRHPD